VQDVDEGPPWCARRFAFGVSKPEHERRFPSACARQLAKGRGELVLLSDHLMTIDIRLLRAQGPRRQQ
jgi:hypothetical protein